MSEMLAIRVSVLLSLLAAALGCGGSGGGGETPQAQYVGRWVGTYVYRKLGTEQERGPMTFTVQANGDSTLAMTDTRDGSSGSGTGEFSTSQDVIWHFAFGGAERRATGRIAILSGGILSPYSESAGLPATISGVYDGNMEFSLTKED